MSIWTLEAINAEVEYRRERNAHIAHIVRVGRRLRSERAERRRAQQRLAEQGSGRRDGERAGRQRDSALPAQRSTGSPATKQPV